jgi:hypothetical protein
MMTVSEYTVHLSNLLRREHDALAEFLVDLAGFDERGLWRELGYATLFDYLHRELGLSRGAAHYRRVGAELVRRFPEIIEPIRDGRLCFSSVLELAKVITAENRAEVLPRFFHRSKAEAKVVAAELRPMEAPPHRDIVTAVRAATAAAGAYQGSRGGCAVDPAQLPVHPDELALPPTGATPARAPAPRDDRDLVEPLTAELRRLHVTVPTRLLDKLARARDALSHSRPAASSAEILEAGLDLLLDRDAKRKGLVEKPQAKLRPAKPQTIRASVLREVWKRDGGRCQFRLANGQICGSTCRVEVHHREARAHGGGHATAKDLVLLCDVHHDLVTRVQFGDDWIDRCVRRRGGRGETTASLPLRPLAKPSSTAPPNPRTAPASLSQPSLAEWRPPLE